MNLLSSVTEDGGFIPSIAVVRSGDISVSANGISVESDTAAVLPIRIIKYPDKIHTHCFL